MATIIDRTAEVVLERAAADKHYGVCLIPEGLIEFIPDVGRLLAAINDLLGRIEAPGDPAERDRVVVHVEVAREAEACGLCRARCDRHGRGCACAREEMHTPTLGVLRPEGRG